MATRENASRGLHALGPRAVPALKAELETNPSLEVARRIHVLLTKSNTPVKVVTGESLRRLRALEILEKIGTTEAQKVLEQLAESSESSPDAVDARFALQRIRNRNANR